MVSKKDDVNLSVITNGCLQVIYTNSTPDVDLSDKVQIFAEYLDVFLVFEGEISIEVFGQKKVLRERELFFCTRSTYAEVSHVSKRFSYARLRYLKDKLPHKNIDERFAASLVGCDIMSRKIFNHCLSYIDLLGDKPVRLSEAEAEVVHSENISILTTLNDMLEQEHEALERIPCNVYSSNVVIKAVDIFEENVETTMKVKSVAEDLLISHSYLVRCFKRTIGVAPNIFWRTMKLNRALTLLSHRMQSLADISYLYGFTDQSHFSNCFKKSMLTTPGSIVYIDPNKQ
jgi:AraC-like DNA-binding protein